MSPSITFRPIAGQDQEFLVRVYASTRAEELAQVDWTDEQKDKFVRMQFRAQHDYYHQQWPEAKYELILADGQPIGRLYVDRREHEIRVMDITLLAEHRGAGIGGQIMGDLLREGDAGGLPVTIHVLFTNAKALRLYERLGFRQVDEVSGHLLLQRAPREEAAHAD